MSEERGPGHPRVRPGEETRRVQLLVGEQQLAEWRAAARREGLSLSAWLRRLADDEAGASAILAESPAPGGPDVPAGACWPVGRVAPPR